MIPRVGMQDSTARREHILEKVFILMEIEPHPSDEARWSAIAEIRNLERSVGACHEEIEQIERASKGSDLGSLKSICDITYSKA